jgi:hypothetical protein
MNILCLGCKKNSVYFYRGIIGFYSEGGAKRINAFCGQNVEFLCNKVTTGPERVNCCTWYLA